MTLGLERGTVALAPHEAAWEAEGARVAAELLSLLGDAAVDAQHVGSTSVRTICAKPIVDVAAAVRDFDAVLARREALERAGYHFRGFQPETEQLLFARGSFYEGTGKTQTHFIHVVLRDGARWRDYLLFRDFLNAHPEDARTYEALKLRLAAENPVDAGRERYLAGKAPLIRRLLHRANAWSFLGKDVHIVVDRPLGSAQVKNGFTTVYQVNYGYLPGVPGGDGEALDVYLLGVPSPVPEADCRVCGIVCREDDDEDKLIAAPAGARFSAAEMAAAVRFQEQWFRTRIEAAPEHV